MSGRKSNLKKFQTITSGDMSQASVTSLATNIQWLDNIGIQFNWTGSPSGNFSVEVSADYDQDFQGNITSVGNWTAISLSPSPATSGGSPAYVDISGISAPWIRSVFTNIGIEAADIATVADTAGSLNSKFFLLNGADGTNWYVWYDNGSGVDPAPASRTGIHVTYTNGDTANTIATLTRAAMAAITSITTPAGATNHVTFSQTQAGPGALTQGSASTGFTLGYTSYSGTLQCYITGKAI